MSFATEIDYAGEGLTDGAVARALIRHAGFTPGTDHIVTSRRRGKGGLDSRLFGLSLAARFRPVLVLRDLDHDAPCPGMLLKILKFESNPAFCIRIAVRAVEAWLLADCDAFAQALGVRRTLIPSNPELLQNPKLRIVDLVRGSSRIAVRDALLPRQGSGIADGQVLGTWLAEFATEQWSPDRAIRSGRTPSLSRAVERLTEAARSFPPPTDSVLEPRRL